MMVAMKFTIKINGTIRQAMEIIDRTALGLTVVESSDGNVIGVISDGDIRRALLAGMSLDDPVKPLINREFVYLPPSASRAEVLDLMQARRIRQIPIIDSYGRLGGIHTLHEILGAVERPNWALIMAGGKGTRLRPLTENVPKPMLKVAGRPILERIVLNLISYGIRKIFIAVNYLAHMIEEYFGDGSRYGCKIEYIHEDKPLGSGGALSLLPELPKHPLLLMNGDLVVNVNFADMFEFHEQNGFYATMGVYPYTHEVPFGCVNIQGDRLVDIEEKPLLQKTINAGIYVLSPKTLAAVPTNTFFPITALFESAMENGFHCGGFNIESEWIDVGMPQQLKQANGVI